MPLTLACMDFETYSEAGYVYDPAASKWRSITASPPHGLGAVGAAVYSEHHSTEVTRLGYDLKDGRGERLWKPEYPPPADLFAYIAAGGLIEAWFSSFEYSIWLNVCRARMGWPALPYDQLRDAMAKAMAHALPGSLAKAAQATGSPVQKIADGRRLLNKFCKPRNPTKNDPRTRIRLSEDPEDAQRMDEYCLGDIRTASAVSALTPELSPHELQVWLLDQRINNRGVSVDTDSLAACRSIVDQAQAQGVADLHTLTGGAVDSPTKLQKLTAWLLTQGIRTDSLDADAVRGLLARTDLTATVRQVLEIRASLGAASVKKLFAMDRRKSADGRLRGLFVYCGAQRTGRFAGRGVQAQNLTNSGPDVRLCLCGRHYGTHRADCPWCGATGGTVVEWGLGAVEDVLAAAEAHNLQCLAYFFGDAVPSISGCLRGLLCAAPGHDLICSDYSAIEAVVLAALAGEEWRLDVFRTHGLIYEMSASKITGVPFEDFQRHKAETGEHHPLRKKIGKIAELACFTRDTQLLTDRGYVSMGGVTPSDKLWDGTEWVKHGGVVCKGKRKVINLDGVQVTPDHPVSLGLSWKAAKQLVLNQSTLSQALVIGSENLPWSGDTGRNMSGGLWSSARAAVRNISSRFQTSIKGSPRGAVSAGVSRLLKPTSKNTPNMPTWFRIPSTAADWLIGYGQLLPGAIVRTAERMRIMAAEAYTYVTNGGGLKEHGPSYYTFSLSMDGIFPRLRWTGLTLTTGTVRAISGSYRAVKTCLTKGKSEICSGKTTNLRPVYDVVNAGPRNRFTIRTDSGHLIVHNSGYGGSVGAWKAFGADKHFDSEEDILTAVRQWRDESPMIVKFWYALQDAATAAIKQPGTCYHYRGISYGVQGDVLYCQLPSGRKLSYHNPRLHPDVTPFGRPVEKITYMGWNSDYKKGPTGWMRLDTWGGKLTENVTQAAARDVFAPAMLRVEAAGYPIVLHTHDEIISEVPTGYGSIEEYELIMCEPLPWCPDWPIRAAGGWRGRRYRKD